MYKNKGGCPLKIDLLFKIDINAFSSINPEIILPQ
jgi:hypothetical protein